MVHGNVQEVYMSIANGMASNIDGMWESAKLEIEWFGDAGDFSGEYFNDGKVGYFDIYDGIFDDIESLYKIMVENDNNKWNKAIFTLEPTGKFNIDFEWDQALADEIERLSKD